MIGCRTIEVEGDQKGNAKAGHDYDLYDQPVAFDGEASKKVEIGIIDDDEWEPDEDFYVELYDRDTSKRIQGDDAKTRVTILDDDKPGFLCFEQTNLKTSISKTELEV